MRREKQQPNEEIMLKPDVMDGRKTSISFNRIKPFDSGYYNSSNSQKKSARSKMDSACLSKKFLKSSQSSINKLRPTDTDALNSYCDKS